MVRRHIFYSTRSAYTLPTVGLVVNLNPESIQTQSGNFSGWKNAVDNSVLGLQVGQPVAYLNDANFNGLSSVEMGQYNALAGFPVSSSEGLTIIHVSKPIAIPDRNMDGMMPWYLDTPDGPLDLWIASLDNVEYRGLFLNSFQGNRQGHDFGQTQADTMMITACVPSQNLMAASLYKNGVYLSRNVSEGGIIQVRTQGTLYPGYVTYSPNYSWTGRHSTFLVYNRLLSAAELEQVHGYLKQRYNIS